MKRDQLFPLLRREAQQIDTTMRHDLQIVRDPMLAEILAYALFNGGKRIRPLLTVLAARLCGSLHDDLYRLAMAFEYLHVASLLHDDIIDQADSRRGRPAVNISWGPAAAILAGDYLHTRSMYLIGTLGGSHCLEIYFQATSAMVEGEFLQMANATHFNQSEEDYFRVVQGKTAQFLAAVCEVGAVFAKGSPAEQQALADYGSGLGTAFQVKDDLLDYLGDQHKTGKAVGNDFVEGKMTLPLIHAMSEAAPLERQRLLDLLQADRADRVRSFPEARALIQANNGFAYAERKANELIAAAMASLTIFDDAAATPHLMVLAGLAQYVLGRET